MKLFSFLGMEEFFMAILPVLYWCVYRILGLRVAIVLMLSTSINGAVKLAFHGPRPYWISPGVRALSEETSFGTPSNHAQSAVVVWGNLAAYLHKCRYLRYTLIGFWVTGGAPWTFILLNLAEKHN
jgi:membrane-associated phospholipid phosphatase